MDVDAVYLAGTVSAPPPFLRGHQSVGAVGKGDDRWLFDGFDRGGEYLERC